MGLFRKDDEPNTAEKYRKRAVEHQAAAKSMRNTFLKTGIFAAAALIAIVMLSVAWFVTNTNVRNANIHISANNNRTFYLATRLTDAQGVYDNNTAGDSSLSQALNKFQRIDRDVNAGNDDISFQGLPQFSVGTTVVTGSDDNEYIVGDADGISLMVNSTSNVNNTAAEEYVGPGSTGEITFYIIPNVEGRNQVRITVSLAAYKLTASRDSTDNKVTARAELIDGSDANFILRNLLCGHMLLFKGKDDNGDYVNQIIPRLGEDGTILFSFEEKGDNWTKNQPVEITIYWIWPHRFENLVYSGQNESVFKISGSAQSDLLSWINANKGFIVNQSGSASLEDASTGMSNSGLSQWSAGYNKGDQLIGDTVAYFIWTISAEN
ncbi:MAG: hypothetical protein ACI4TA_01160 [Acetatifactor sp.]